MQQYNREYLTNNMGNTYGQANKGNNTPVDTIKWKWNTQHKSPEKGGTCNSEHDI